MAQQDEKPRERPRRRRTVPVSSRDAEGAARRKPRRPKVRLGTAEIGVLVVVTILILAAIAVPLRNYFQGRSEIARLNESIAAKELEKELLLEEIERYNDEAFIREEARRRLGLIEPGETAFRIIDPAMEQDPATTTSEDEGDEPKPWYEILWGSIAEPPKPEPEDIDTHMPIEPPAEAPAAPEDAVQ
ncbi:septum formation initiator family protein [Corynebacterium halotolerans]|uniref:Septum formation initiator n=1 Tax=Corynebacterium halotolerans YIM 70093 = DSM 44683 TaxID=1121362 RepID=M1NKS7_9CORY|nr:septum formation initiator family protein [Corynebacterium halotolerans]AGF71978.1 hypothetical protein A605_04850 [Corynebacterium halotolerans YIM 70093 = DSM 44683]